MYMYKSYRQRDAVWFDADWLWGWWWWWRRAGGCREVRESGLMNVL